MTKGKLCAIIGLILIVVYYALGYVHSIVIPRWVEGVCVLGGFALIVAGYSLQRKE